MNYVFVFFFQGFGDRLLSEIKKLAPKNMKLKVIIILVTNLNNFLIIYNI